jgi:hypothetical protein
MFNNGECKAACCYSALIVQGGVLFVFYQLFCNCPMLSQSMSAVHKRAATGGTLKEIMTSILPLKRPTDYMNQGRTGSHKSMTKMRS